MEPNEAVLTKKILNAPLTEADFLRLQYGEDGFCYLFLFSVKEGKTWGIAIDKETANGFSEVLSSFVNDVPTVDLRADEAKKVMYG